MVLEGILNLEQPPKDVGTGGLGTGGLTQVYVITNDPTNPELAFSAGIVVSEKTNKETKYTNFPVEDGSFITDHVQNEPRIFELQINKSVDEDGSTEKLYERILSLQNQYLNLWIISPLYSLRDMRIITTSVTQDADTGRNLFVNLTLKEVRIVSSVVSSLDASTLTKKNKTKASSVQNQAKNTTPELGGTPIKNESWAISLARSIGVIQ